jgi:hypothetical protein
MVNYGVLIYQIVSDLIIIMSKEIINELRRVFAEADAQKQARLYSGESLPLVAPKSLRYRRAENDAELREGQLQAAKELSQKITRG